MGNSGAKEPEVDLFNDAKLKQYMQFLQEAQQRHELDRESKRLSEMMEQMRTASLINSENTNKNPSSPNEAIQTAARNSSKAKLPTFTGNPEEWHYFRASYETSTTECGFSDSENLVRLLDSLQGPALQSVRGLLVLPKLVPKAIDTLHRLYGNPETLLEWHVEKVRKLENPDPTNVSTCVAFTNALEQLCAIIEVSELEHRMTDSDLLKELVHKLPHLQIVKWNGHVRSSNQPITLRTFRDFASKMLSHALEANPTGYTNELKKVLPDQALKTDQSNSIKTEAFEHVKPGTSNTAGAGDQEKKEDRKRCRLCKRFGHPLWHCNEFKALKVEARSALVDSWNLCRICLGDHLIEGKQICLRRLRCNVDKCRERHNSLLHPAKAKEESDDNNSSFDSFHNIAYYDDEGTLRLVNKSME